MAESSGPLGGRDRGYQSGCVVWRAKEELRGHSHYQTKKKWRDGVSSDLQAIGLKDARI